MRILHDEYPWDRWFNKTTTIHRHKDFDCQVHSMAAQIRNKACKHGLRVSLRIVENSITISKKGN